MTIAEVREKCKSLFTRTPKDALILAILLLASTGAFGFGYLAGVEAERIHTLPRTDSPSIDTVAEERVVGSKSGMKYYAAWCAGADRIGESNKIWFDSASAAQAAGYTPAANCDGL